ncbi:hypothetical protein E2P86_06225 [Sphingobacterium psychroaquaticum]|uniref:hypothetical protein n=1 Tax=Sphingobacterium psychroaquaticum TaxID=561061 RepID=UPI00106DBB93|nr:hypothetical protein [Sphingobacterium psychroaquaticum]QBQ40768.1 hypothetical protein E2P86_06225 [Sphingobacterium psychroaquaticum]
MNKLFKMTVLACVITVGFTACDKDDKPAQEEKEYQAKVMVKEGETVDLTKVSKTKNSEGTINRKGQIYSVRNFRQFTLGEDGKPTTTVAKNFYIDFKENDGVTEAEAVITLPAELTAILKSNTEKGYTLRYIDKAFDAVTANDTFLEAPNNTLGLESQYTPNVIGWLIYTGRPNHQVNTKTGRTIVVFKDNKPFFKFRVNSVYSNETMEKEVQPGNYFYYSIDYQEFK